MKIQDIMTQESELRDAGRDRSEAAQVMNAEDVGIVPVVDGAVRQVVWSASSPTATSPSVASPKGKDGTCRVRDVMSSGELATCGRRRRRRSLMEAMRTEKVRRIPIVDERGSLVGIVSQADIVRKAGDDRQRRANRRAISEPGGRHAT